MAFRSHGFVGQSVGTSCHQLNYTCVETPVSLEPTTSPASVHSSNCWAKSLDIRLRGNTALHSSSFLESLVFSPARYHRLLPNQSPGQVSQPHCHCPLNPQCPTTLGCRALVCTGVTNPWVWAENLLFEMSAENCMKMKEMGWGASLSPPGSANKCCNCTDSPTHNLSQVSPVFYH